MKIKKNLKLAVFAFVFFSVLLSCNKDIEIIEKTKKNENTNPLKQQKKEGFFFSTSNNTDDANGNNWRTYLDDITQRFGVDYTTATSEHIKFFASALCMSKHKDNPLDFRYNNPVGVPCDGNGSCIKDNNDLSNVTAFKTFESIYKCFLYVKTNGVELYSTNESKKFVVEYFKQQELQKSKFTIVGLMGHGVRKLPDGSYDKSWKAYTFKKKLRNGQYTIFEYQINAALLSTIDSIAKEKGVNFINTMPKDTADTPLAERVRMINEIVAKNPPNRTIVLEIHHNAGKGHKSGKEVDLSSYIYRENSTSEQFANALHDEIEKVLPNFCKRGVIKEDFYVIKNVDCPAVLTEFGFFDDYEEANQILDPKHRIILANAVVKAILEFKPKITPTTNM